MLQALIAGAIAGVIVTGIGAMFVHGAVGIFGLCSRLARGLDRAPNYLVILGCFSITLLVMVYLTHG